MDTFNVFEAVRRLFKEFPAEAEELEPYIFDDEGIVDIWTLSDTNCVFNYIANLLMQETCTLSVAKLFGPLLPELLSRCSRVSSDDEDDDEIDRHESICRMLSQLIWLFPDVQRFAYQYFETSPPIFIQFEDEIEDPPNKKAKIDLDCKSSNLCSLLQAALQFLAFDLDYFKDLWNWSILSIFMTQDDRDVKWLAYQCSFRLANTNSTRQTVILENVLTRDDLYKLNIKYGQLVQQILSYNITTKKTNKDDDDDDDEDDKKDTHSIKLVSDETLSDDVVNVAGILLNKFDMPTEGHRDVPLVLVNSVKSSLHELALAVSSCSPVLLQGSVGCGKTSLIEYLTMVTGRNVSTHLVKIQLGDHTDSKTLLGSYCCTETPGEFVWKPGILTRAIKEGYWLLLEDIDCAPLDVITTLAPVFESHTLILPNQVEPIRAHPDFQLFATQRLLTGHGRSYVQFRSNAERLKKFWRKITIPNLPIEELTEVITKKWPNLEPIIDRILEIFYQFSSDPNREDYLGDEILNLPASIQKCRLVSTRDLFKFCKRIAHGFNVQSSDASTMLQHALDCFCGSFPDVSSRIMSAEYIGVKLSIPNSKASYYCTTYKPDIEEKSWEVKIGRANLPIKSESTPKLKGRTPMSFAYTRQALSFLEKVSVAVSAKEPVLLVGETGTGKTSIVQFLANNTNNKLTVINMNQQSDSVDLVGGYKPVDLKMIVAPVKDDFTTLFPLSFSVKQNSKFLGHVAKCFHAKRWHDLFELMLHIQMAAVKRYTKEGVRPLPDTKSLLRKWSRLGNRIEQLQKRIQQNKIPIAFSFIEGALVKALKKGEWILLDEINLAEAETLQCLGGLLESDVDSIHLLEKGDKEPVKRHPDFRIFACMNPGTDIGKKELPAGIRNRFTEFFVEELEDKKDLMILVESYLSGLAAQPMIIENIVNLYLFIRTKLVNKLNDGTGHRPHYSLRTLCRALKCAATNSSGSLHRSLFEGFSLSFLSQLDRVSYPIMESTIKEFILGKTHLPVLNEKIPEPCGDTQICVQGYWIPAGSVETEVQNKYVLTPSVEKNLQNLARIVSLGRYPVLLQGETSVGKTSLVQYLADLTGNVCVRVNNHEHTDIEEYVGNYCADDEGKLVYKEGILVEAMQQGYWIILDELNLAPSEVMEALNRVLDDNRELFLTETQQTIKAHPKFMVFATQNPPGLYGGRKILSRAFRNRFIELYFDEIPRPELEVILEKRCSVPPSYCKKMVSVMHDLQLHRRESGIFSGKQSFITLRDLFRWGERYRQSSEGEDSLYDWAQHMADEGYMLLAGRVRRDEEESVIRQVLHKHMKRQVNPVSLFSFESKSRTIVDVLKQIVLPNISDNFKHITWTQKMRRMAILLGKALAFEEPVLLIGNTGCGKTTVCQIFAEFNKKKLHMVNCHMHSESADFLGNLRPVRNQEDSSKLFEWVDGPLVSAMESGDFFLVDEISLADDSVLERLNSVLEPQRELRLTEKYSAESNESAVIVAKKDFRIMATMNPGGDYGKKELSPALRNRFTEIWCPSELLDEDILAIVGKNIRSELVFGSIHGNSGFGQAIAEFVKWYRGTAIGKRTTISARDIVTWVRFINTTALTKVMGISFAPYEAYVHGACLVFLDSLGSSAAGLPSPGFIKELRKTSYQFLEQQLERFQIEEDVAPLMKDLANNWEKCRYYEGTLNDEQRICGFGPFYILAAESEINPQQIYDVQTSTTRGNGLRIVRAMKLRKPILLEGSPGVGKSSLVATLANLAGYDLVRINLSEQTDISDLFGTDLPAEGGEPGKFTWRDGPLLEGLKAGSWILLDELNLASQSVLEGLNACLDHRGEIFIPELSRSFSVSNRSTRIFGCQNPFRQGGSRKGLPKSFLNRFTQVYMEPLTPSDLRSILGQMYPTFSAAMIEDMVELNEKVNEEICSGNMFRADSYVTTYNLRDLFRWCDVVMADQLKERVNPAAYTSLIYAERLRNRKDKKKLQDLCENHFGLKANTLSHQIQIHVFDTYLQVGHSFLPRKGHGLISGHLIYPMHCQLPFLESLTKCIEMNWLSILVGPAASGKTTMVKMLASMTGNKVKFLSVNADMDTTELLGGFEQCDLNRTISNIMEDLNPLIHQAITLCLLKPDQLHLLWSVLNAFHAVRNVRPSKKSYCRHRIQSINELVAALDNVNYSEDDQQTLSEIKCRILEVSDQVDFSSAVSVGGCFEWVDSVLVQAVRKGFWLVIEDVNLCSPSVLDRLNSLLEPGGVLSIAEQGAIECDPDSGIQQSKIRVIRPHPDFRLIFTMNPANGEISPAMRNRGVEIAISNEITEFEHSNVAIQLWDIHSMMYAKRMCDPQGMFYLVNLYRLLHCKTFLDKPTLYDFQNAITYCVQLLQKGKKLPEALLNSYNMSFVKNILDVNDREVCYTRICDEVSNKDLTQLWEPQPYQELMPLIAPSIVDFQHSHLSSSLRQHYCLFAQLTKLFLSSLSNNVDSSAYCIPGPSYPIPLITATDEWIGQFSTALKIFLESCSYRQGRMFHIWFRSVYEQIVDSFSEHHVERLRYFKRVFNPIKNLVERHLVSFLCSDVSIAMVDYIEGLISTMKNDERKVLLHKDDIPLDPRWNPQLFQKLLYSAFNMSYTERGRKINVTHISNELCSLSNRYLLLLNLSLFHFLEMSAIEDVIVPRGKYPSLFELAERVNKGQISIESLPHRVIMHVPCLLSTLYTTFKMEIEQTKVAFTDERFWEIWNIVKTFHLFLKFCKKPILDIPIEDHLIFFGMHLTTMVKSVTLVCNLLSPGKGMPENMTDIIELTTQDLCLELVPFEKTRLKIRKNFGFPSAFISENMARAYTNVVEIHDKSNIVSLLNLPGQRENLKIAITNRLKWNSTMVEAACNCLANSKKDSIVNPDVISSVHEIKLQLQDLGLLESNDDEDEIMEICQQPAKSSAIKESELVHYVELLPLWEYVFIHAEVVFLNCTLGTVKGRIVTEPPPGSDKFLYDLGVNKLNLDPIHIGQLLALCKDDNKNLFSSCLGYFLNLLHSGPIISNQELCYTWYKKELIQHQASKQLSWDWQSPLLTTACLRIFAGSEESSTLALPLRNFTEKKQQIEVVKSLLWRSRESLGKDLFWNTMAKTICNWNGKLLTSLSAFAAPLRPESNRSVCDQLWSDLKLGSILTYSKSNALIDAKDCISLMRSLVNCENRDTLDLNWAIGTSFVKVGLLTYVLFAPLYLHDPIQKLQLNFNCTNSQFRDCLMEFQFQDWQNQAVGGKPWQEILTDVHPYIVGFSTVVMDLKTKTEDLKSKLSYRPSPSQFSLLKNDIQQYFSLVGSPNAAQDLLNLLNTQKKNMNRGCEGNVKKTIQSLNTFIINSKSFIKSCMEKFPCYRDLLYPFLTGIEMLLIGLQMLGRNLSCYSTRMKYPCLKSVESVLIKMCSFPTVCEKNALVRPLDLGLFLSSSDTIQAFLCLKSLAGAENSDSDLFKLLRSALLEIVNDAVIVNRGSTKELVNAAEPILSQFHKALLRQEEELKRKQAEEESLYHQKGTTYEGDLSEEESMKKSITTAFPSYEEEYKDFIPISEYVEEEPIKIKLSLTPDDVMDIWSCHATLMSKLCEKVDDKRRLVDNDRSRLTQNATSPLMKTYDAPDHTMPYLSRYEVFQSLLPCLQEVDSSIDIHLFGGHLLAASSLQLQSDFMMKKQNVVAEQYYNIYHDSNTVEAVQVIPILECLVSRVDLLLKEFPDNPLLVETLRITNRVQSFPVTSPIIKLVTGLELVLESAQAWEQNAHKKVSLQLELEAITQKIVQWRKLEHKCWSQCLNTVIRKEYIDCSKWWSNIYALIFNAKGDEVKLDILSSVEQFIEDCTIGQFGPRLELLQTFVQHLVLAENTRSNKKMRNILFNVVAFYKQFLPSIEKQITKIRTPIEKEVKDFVLICKWNPSNFFSLKKSVEKIHQTLHKCMHKFQVELGQMARKFFVAPEKKDIDEREDSVLSISFEPLDFVFVPNDSIESRLLPIVEEVLALDEIFDRLPFYQNKVNKLCKNAFKAYLLVEPLDAINKFAGDVVEKLEFVQGLEVKKNADKKVEMKEYRHNLQLKNKVLSDLLKDMKVIGLSYRKGLIYLENLKDSEKYHTMLVPFIRENMWEEFGTFGSYGNAVIESWLDASGYYYKCIAQTALLESYIHSPNRPFKDNTMLQKFKGFAGHILLNIVSHRHQIFHETAMISEFSSAVESLTRFIDDRQQLNMSDVINFPTQLLVKKWKAELASLLAQTSSAFNQFDVLLKCCPAATEVQSITLHPNQSSSLSSCIRGDKLWSTLVSDTNACMKEVKSIIITMSPFLESNPKIYTWRHRHIIQINFDKLETLVSKFVKDHCDSMSENLNSGFTSFLLNLKASVSDKLNRFNEDFYELCSPSIEAVSAEEEEITVLSRKLVNKVLKSVENLYSLCCPVKEDDAIPKLFTQKLYGNLWKLSEGLNVQPCVMLIKKIMKNFLVYETSEKKTRVLKRYVLNALPILQQYSQMLNLFVFSMVEAQRSSCNLLTTVLDVFLEFAQKGYGTPPCETESSGGGGTEFHNIEDGGLGDGEGTKDVSKNITSEDQLDDALLEGAERNESDQGDIEDEDDGIEMSEDFESKMFGPKEGDSQEEDKDEGEDEEDSELNKKMGDVDDPESDKLDERIWGDESEDEEKENLGEDDSGKGVADGQSSELVAKDNKKKDVEKDIKDNGNSDKCPDLKNEGEYDGEHVDPLIDAPPLLEPEIMDLPKELQIGSDEDTDNDNEETETNPMDIDAVKDDDDDVTTDYNETEKDQNLEQEVEDGAKDLKDQSDIEMENDDMEKGVPDNIMEDDADVKTDNDENNTTEDVEAAGDHTLQKSMDKAQASDGVKGSSQDFVEPMEGEEEWEGGGQDEEGQHNEGQSGQDQTQNLGHQGARSSLPASSENVDQEKRQRGMRRSDIDRTLGDVGERAPKRLKVRDTLPSGDAFKKPVGITEGYEHVKDDQEAHHQTLDAATPEQARQQRQQQSIEEDDDDDVIALDSSSEEEEIVTQPVPPQPRREYARSISHLNRRFRRDSGAGKSAFDKKAEAESSGEFIRTQAVPSFMESSIHTQYNLWNSLSSVEVVKIREETEHLLNVWKQDVKDEKEDVNISFRIWQNIETVVNPLVQELCEQLRLVLEPTKMAKMKGDYRTGKRLNMRKIIPYIASQFRKDKIWLRRTKPSHRQYQILLAVDDSYSMSDNHSKELAYESLALLGKSLSFIESGELAVVSFGENVRLLHGFGEPFTNYSGAQILESFTFAQNKTRVCHLLEYVNKAMTEARGIQSKLISKEIAQLLVIISDGRGVFNEGEEALKMAIRQARASNIFMVFIVLDSPVNKDSILDIQRTEFDKSGNVHLKSYMESFPFPFYVILRSIDALPQVLGEALRQWFELVTSVER